MGFISRPVVFFVWDLKIDVRVWFRGGYLLGSSTRQKCYFGDPQHHIGERSFGHRSLMAVVCLIFLLLTLLISDLLCLKLMILKEDSTVSILKASARSIGFWRPWQQTSWSFNLFFKFTWQHYYDLCSSAMGSLSFLG